MALKQRLSNFTVNPTANINQFLIKRVSTVKSLGVHIDENLTWECHINELSKKIASGISAIKRIRHSVPYKTLLSVYWGVQTRKILKFYPCNDGFSRNLDHKIGTAQLPTREVDLPVILTHLRWSYT